MSAAPASRPGLLRRLLAGAWHVPGGFVFLLRHPSLWPLAALPAVLTAVLFAAGLGLSWYYVPRVEDAFAPSPSRVGDVLALMATVALGLLTLATGALLGFALGLVLAGPLLDRLSEHTERLVAGRTSSAPGRGFRFEVKQSLKAALFFAIAVPLAFLAGLVPFVGPLLATLWAGFAVGLELTDGPLARRGLAFSEKLRWHRRWRPESLGFGLLGLLALLVPLANLLMAPALVVGATRLVLELLALEGEEPVRHDERTPRPV
jgi:CysZ protein